MTITTRPTIHTNSGNTFKSLALTLAIVTVVCCLPSAPRKSLAGPPRVLPKGKVPDDSRLGPLRGERGDFSFVSAKSPAGWKGRAKCVRQIMRVALGLWPMPTKTPLQAVVHGRLDRGDHTVEKVYFESIPGFFVTGNLYRPKGPDGKRPGVLSPHGHFPGGRFQDAGRDYARRQIVQGAERFEEGGRSFMQSRCVQLARMGCVVFHYDMIGYGDNLQLSEELVHRFSRSRIKYEQPPASGFYSAEAESQLQNVMGLHTYNSIRALDFLTSLPDVDPERIAVTGGSGGGTQTFMLCAIDDQPLVSVPVVIVSSTRQGGCTCENICGFRIGTYNLEFTALHAPKPLLLISADDATRTMGQRGFPELKQHYRALGAPQNVSHVALLQFPHNYNHVSRTAMYHWLNKHLRLGLDEPILEKPYKRLTKEQMSVWDNKHPQPEGGPKIERKLLDWLTEDSNKQLAALTPHNRQSLDRYREVVGGAWNILLRSQSPDAIDVQFEPKKTNQRSDHQETLGLLQYQTSEQHQAELPIVKLLPKTVARRVVIWIDQAGKSGLYENNGTLKPAIQKLLAAGNNVIGVDLLYQGEFLADGKPVNRVRSLPGEEAFAGWTYCYNLPLFARRVHDVLATVALADKEKTITSEIDLVALGGAGKWVAAALGQARGRVVRAVVDTGGFRFADLTNVYGVDFLPGGAKYNDLPGALSLAAPTKLWLAGERKEVPMIVRAAYKSAAEADNLTIFSGESKSSGSEAIEWLLRE